MNETHGVLALIGGGEWTEACEFDAELLRASGSDEILVLPTAAAYEQPEFLAARAGEYFAQLGGRVEGLMVTSRQDAMDAGMADVVRRARFIYLAGGSSLHLKSVLKNSPVWEALVGAYHQGAVVAASSDAALAITDPMVDARGGALTVGLGLVEGVAVVPHYDPTTPADKLIRTVQLAPPDLPVVGISSQTALIMEPDGRWRISGAGPVAIYLDGERVDDLGVLPA